MDISVKKRDESMEAVLPGNNTSYSYKKLDYRLESDGSVLMRLSMGIGSAFFTAGGVLFALPAFILLVWFSIPKAFSLLFILAPLPIAVLCILLGFQFDQYYVANKNTRKFGLVSKRFGLMHFEELFPLEKVHCISVDYQSESHKTGRTHLYAVTLVKKDGQLLVVSDFLNYDRLQSINKRAGNLAKLLEVPFVPGQEMRGLHPRPGKDGSLEIQFGPERTRTPFSS